MHYLFQNEDSNGYYFVEPLRGTALHLIELFKFQFQFAIFVMCYKLKFAKLLCIMNRLNGQL